MTRNWVMTGDAWGMWGSDLVGFDISGFNEFFPACKFSRLESGELLGGVGHNFETQIKQFCFDLWVIQALSLIHILTLPTILRV